MEKSPFRPCLFCAEPLLKKEIFCSCCGAIQPYQDTLSYYEVLDIPEALEVPEKILEEAYKKRMKVVHPDKHINASEKEKEQAIEWSGLINDAYEVLKDPIQRLTYWIKTKEPRSKEQKPDMEVLAAVMEIEEAIRATENIAPLKDKIETFYKNALFSAYNQAKNKKYEESLKYLSQAQYWINLHKRYNFTR